MLWENPSRSENFNQGMSAGRYNNLSKKALITGITGQDGSYLLNCCCQKAMRCTALSVVQARSIGTHRPYLYRPAHPWGPALFVLRRSCRFRPACSYYLQHQA